MPDRPCRWFNPSDYEWDESESCAHPLLAHFSGGGPTHPIRTGKCHGCPCHEPAQSVGILDDFKPRLQAFFDKQKPLDAETMEIIQQNRWIMYEPAQGADTEECCVWEQNPDGYWNSDKCGICWEFQEGGPAQNGCDFCPRCGHKIKIAPQKRGEENGRRE